MAKRVFDILLSLLGLTMACPFFLAIAIFIKLDSKGAVFFRQVRIGKNGRSFQMLKFRTMMEVEHWKGPPVSPTNDPRVTALGAILRRFKINEFPQLINVLKGDMSFVGPRPEIPEFVKLYSHEQERILSVRPGIVGPSQISMRNEEELYAEDADPKEYYINHILPKKLKIDMEYVDNRSFLRDMLYLVQGVLITITGAVSRRHIFENSEQIVLFFCDVFICALSYSLSYFLRVEGELLPIHRDILIQTLPFVIVARMFILMWFGLYGTLISYFSFDDLVKIIKGVTLSSVLIMLLTFLVGERSHPRSVFAIDWFIVVLFLGGYRLTFKSLRERVSRGSSESKVNILIYGAGNTGDLALRFMKMRNNGKVVAFIDDDPKKLRKSIHGLKVLGNRHDIEALVRLYNIDKIVLAMNDIDSADLEQIKSLCEKANVEYEVFALAK